MRDKLNAEDKIKRAIITLQKDNPFWAYLILKLRVSEDTEGKLPEFAGAGVNAKGQMIYKKEFIDNLSDKETEFVLAHEMGHLMFAHLLRINQRNPLLWNVCTDTVLNNVLRMNGFTPLNDSIVPDYSNSIELFGKRHENIDKKTAEQLYDEISPQSEEELQKVRGFDAHMDSDEKLSEEQKQELQDRWKESVIEAATYSKQRGKLPSGMEELIGKIMNPKHNWRQMLRKYITNMLPYDYSFSRANRKIPEIILPGVVKETIDIVAHIDTSGSISNEELTMFTSELVGMALSHQNLNMTLIECDAQIQQVIEVNSRNVNKLKSLKVKGRGGTSHKPLWDWIKKNKPNCKLFVSLTDLYSDVEKADDPKCNVLWLVTSDYHNEVPFGQILKLG